MWAWHGMTPSPSKSKVELVESSQRRKILLVADQVLGNDSRVGRGNVRDELDGSRRGRHWLPGRSEEL